MTGEPLKLTPSETVTIRTSTEELLEVEGRWGPGGKPPPGHYHPSQDEHFEVIEGTLTAIVDGKQRELGPGETLDIPRGTAHKMWNSGDRPTRAIWQTRPALRTEDWFRSIDRVLGEGRVRKDGMPGLLAFGAFLSEYDDVFRLAAPQLLARPVIGLLGLLGRARGYEPRANF